MPAGATWGCCCHLPKEGLHPPELGPRPARPAWRQHPCGTGELPAGRLLHGRRGAGPRLRGKQLEEGFVPQHGLGQPCRGGDGPRGTRSTRALWWRHKRRARSCQAARAHPAARQPPASRSVHGHGLDLPSSLASRQEDRVLLGGWTAGTARCTRAAAPPRAALTSKGCGRRVAPQDWPARVGGVAEQDGQTQRGGLALQRSDLGNTALPLLPL